MPPSTHNDLLTEQLGDRLLRVEGAVSEINTNTALTAQSVQLLSKKLEEGFEEVGKRLDEGAKQFSEHEGRIGKNDDRMTALEKVEADRMGRWNTAKKAVFALAAAAAGVLATKGGEAAWDWIVSHLG